MIDSMSIPLFFFRKTPPVDDHIQLREAGLLLRLETFPGLQVNVGFSLYDYPVSHDFVKKVQHVQGPIIALSWQPVRATFALLQKIGISTGGADGKEILLFGLTETDSDEEILGSISVFLKKFPALSDASGPMHRETAVPSRRWYPIIDRQKCVACLECVNFCLFGVYTIHGENRPVVSQPDSCRDGCPACSRVCPAGAILFPEHDDPVIAGRVSRDDSGDDCPTMPQRQSLDDLMDQVDQFEL